MLRAFVAVASAVALQLAALGAPLFHAHLDDHQEGHHHGTARVHAHLGGHDSHYRGSHGDGPAVSGGESPERATKVQLFVAVERLPFAIPALPQARYTLSPPFESILPRPPAVAHSHDPPDGRSSSPRAPPRFLS